jgi:iron complex outermembrane receptor protein
MAILRKISALHHGPLAAAMSLAFALSGNAAQAQTTDLPPVVVSGKLPAPAADVTGFGSTPLERSPFAAQVHGAEQMKDAGTQRLSDITRSDASVGDAYNAEGYWDQLSVRGFVLDQRYNYRREGLPINAETSIALDNKERIEVLQGASGIQAGTSAPGGLVNFVVKRPDDVERRSVLLGWRGAASVLGAVDLGTRFGVDKAFGVRLNAAAEHLDPELRAARGERHLFALAGDWRVGADTLLEAEIESSHRSQPSQPGFSLLGGRVPDARAIDPRLNLNNQPWSQPVVLDGTTATLRWQQRLSEAWRMTATLGTQRLKSDDRIAFPFGCTAESNFDRYCSDGSFDFYDFRSDDERRRSDAADLSFSGRVQTGAVTHELVVGALRSRFESRLHDYAYNFVGTGTIDGNSVVPPDPSLTQANVNRDERSTELYARDALHLGERWTAWLGLRHTRLARSSIDTQGNAGPSFAQSFTTPWFALSHEFAPRHIVYASWGEGIESAVTPNLPGYGSAAGTPLPALKSRQFELGLKGHGAVARWSVGYFDIDRPATTDTGSAFFVDGGERHRGVEANVEAALGAWTLGAGAMRLDAKRHGSSDPALDGLRPTNVPAQTLKLAARWRVDPLPGLELLADAVHEGDRMALPDNSARIPAWTRLDTGLRFERRLGGAATVWRAGVDNLLDRRAWRESPFQFGHAYLYPLAPRTWRLSVQIDL